MQGEELEVAVVAAWACQVRSCLDTVTKLVAAEAKACLAGAPAWPADAREIAVAARNVAVAAGQEAHSWSCLWVVHSRGCLQAWPVVTEDPVALGLA